MQQKCVPEIQKSVTVMYSKKIKIISNLYNKSQCEKKSLVRNFGHRIL